MAFLVTSHRAFRTHFIPSTSRGHFRLPVQHHHPVRHQIPRYLPILHAPTLTRESLFFYDEQEQEEFELPTIVPAPYYEALTREISVRVPTFAPQQNYPKYQLPRLVTQPIRRAQRKYPPYIYFQN